MISLDSALESYLLQNELAQTSIEYYRKSVQVFRRWQVAANEPTFTAETVSRFLLAKQSEGRSSHYRASLRNALRALLRFSGQPEKLRQVKLSALVPAAWTPEEIARLITACDHMPEASRAYWQTLIAAAWYTGLSQADLHRVRIDDFTADGLLEIARRKTGRIAIVKVPPELLQQIRPHSDGRCWPLLTSRERAEPSSLGWRGVRESCPQVPVLLNKRRQANHIAEVVRSGWLRMGAHRRYNAAFSLGLCRSGRR